MSHGSRRGNFPSPFAAPHVESAGIYSFLQLQPTDPEITRDLAGVTNEAARERVMQLPRPDFPVGSQYAYGGTGHTLLALIVAIVSGQSFADFLKVNVFDPLGMKHTIVYDARRPARRQPAQGYWNERGRFQRWDYSLLTAGDGGLFSTLDDLFLWDQALNTNASSQTPRWSRLLPPAQPTTAHQSPMASAESRMSFHT